MAGDSGGPPRGADLDARIAALKEMARAASPAPWSWHHCEDLGAPSMCVDWQEPTRGGTVCTPYSEVDAAFIVAARNVIVPLIDELEAARAREAQAVRLANDWAANSTSNAVHNCAARLLAIFAEDKP